MTIDVQSKLQRRLLNIFETGNPARIVMPSGAKVRVVFKNGFLRASTVATRGCPSTLIVESSDPKQVALQLAIACS